MDKSIQEQVLNLINKSKNILMLTHARADADGLGSMITMYKVLKKLGKDVTAVTSDATPESLQFLPNIDIVQNELATTNDFVITLDTSTVEAGKIKYNVADNKVNIIVSPKGDGAFSASDVSFGAGAAQYDLIMTFDTGNLEHLGSIYDSNTEMFFDIPVINVDHHASNTDYGVLNLVDVTSSSTTEVVYELLKTMEEKEGQKFVDEDIATLLLAGIITDTGSFQHANTSPKSMETAAELLDKGARQKEIIKHIYKTKKLSTLKLWGIVLSKVQIDPVYRMVWSSISEQDLREAGADSEETGDIIDSLLSNAPGSEVIFLIKENPKEGYTSVSMRSTSNSIDVGKLCTTLGGGGHIRAAGAKIKGAPHEQAVNTIIEAVRNFQAERLNIHPGEENEAQPQELEHGTEVELNTPKEPEQAPQTGPSKETYLNFNAPKEEQQSQPEQKHQEQSSEQTSDNSKRKRRRRKKKSQQQPQAPNNTPETPAPAEAPAEPEWLAKEDSTAPEKAPEPQPQPQPEPTPQPEEQTPPKDIPDWLKPE